MLFAMFDYVMRKLGRKYAFVDVYGEVSTYRYYVFFMENKTAKTWKDKYLPNMFVHNFVGDESKQWIDNEIFHTHPWDSVSIVIKGGYIEEEDHSGVTKEITAPAIVPRSWKTSHRFRQMTPNTWTLWFHGIRKKAGKWAFDIRVHDVVCPACIKHNNGVCMNVTGLQEFKDPKPTSAQNYKWREPTWMKCDDELENVITERKKVLARANITTPATFSERFELTKTVLVRTLASKKTETV
jgi:hypothetical protein